MCVLDSRYRPVNNCSNFVGTLSDLPGVTGLMNEMDCPEKLGHLPWSCTSCIGYANAGISIAQSTNIMLRSHNTFSVSFEEDDLGEFPHA
jgi:hypothetical protein